MVKRLFLLPLLCVLLSTQTTLAAEFTASVDRTQVTEQDTLTLKLRLNEQVIYGKPDLKPLEKDFKIQGQQRSQQFRSINGNTESFTEWNIGLIPRRTGKLHIPAIAFKGDKSQAIDIEVRPISAAISQQTEKDFFFDIEVTPKTQPLVQSQLLYKEKLYYAENHNDANLSEFKVTDARLQPLGEVKNYTTIINGRRFGVYERQFAIFPEATGELVIPGSRFHASVPNAYDRWSRGRTISVVSKPIKMEVSAIPAGYPSDAAWLPATQLSISETFSQEPSQWQVGEAVTRTIKIQAQGIPGNQLPDLSPAPVSGLRYYPDQAIHDEQVTEQGVVGHSEQSVAIVAAHGGKFTLPEIRIPWWNTRTNKLEYAQLPAHEINVNGAKAQPSTPAQPINDKTQPNSINHLDTVAATSNQAATANPLLWLVVTLLGVSLITNILLLVTRKKSKTSTPTASEDAAESNSKRQYWQDFSQACNRNNGIDIRHNLLKWVNTGGLKNVTPPVTSLSALAKQVSNPSLGNALLELDSLLYSSSSNSAYSGQNLKTLIEQEKKRPKDINENNGLYPDF